MRFLVDECTGPVVAKWLQSESYEVFSVYDQARGMTDREILAKAYAENWILITNDKDFGEAIFAHSQPHRGIVFLRLHDERAVHKVAALKNLLELHKTDLPDHFVVVTETQIRIR